MVRPSASITVMAVTSPPVVTSMSSSVISADITLEDMLVTTGGDVTAITVIDADGRTIGSADRQDIMDKIRQQAPAK